jgi:hypothetical protein
MGTKLNTGTLLTVLTLLTLNGPAACGDLRVQGYDANRHDRFVNDDSFIGSDYDWSGVSSGLATGSAGRWATLISPTHFLSANHFHPGAGASTTFFHTNDASGPSETRTVVGGRSVGGDLWLGRLDEAVSADVAIYSILNPTSALGSEVHVLGLADTSDRGQSQRIGRNVIDRVELDFNTGIGTGHIITYDYDNPGGVGADEARVAGGDSGGPSFVIANGAPALVGIHWFNYADDTVGEFGDSPTGSGDSFVSAYIDEINAELALFGESLTITSTPEPSSLLLAGLLFGPLAGMRRRRTVG